MDPVRCVSSTGDLDSLRRRYEINAQRPTVIYFSGLLNKNDSRDLAEDPGMLFAKSNQMKRSVKNCSADSDEYESEDMEQYEEDSQGRTCFESNDNLLPKRQRTSFTKVQRNRLEEEFHHDAYIIGMKRWRLSEELEVPEKKIKIWFQNRRTKMKKGY